MNRGRLDRIGGRAMAGVTLAACLLLAVMTAGLVAKSWPILSRYPVQAWLCSGEWRPLKGQFGFLPFVAGTLAVTGVAVVLAVPISLLTAIYLSEYAGWAVRRVAASLMDVMAGIPSVIYGVWGIVAIVPLVKRVLAPMAGVTSSGYSVLAAGIVLAVMICPYIIHLCIEVFRGVPEGMREAALAVGATRWEMVKHVVLRKSLSGILAANVLGLCRAFGETMAVLMVAGNVVRIPRSVFDPAYPLPALIANNYGEMMSIPLYDSALMLAALLLLGIVMVFSLASRLVLDRVRRKVG